LPSTAVVVVMRSSTALLALAVAACLCASATAQTTLTASFWCETGCNGPPVGNLTVPLNTCLNLTNPCNAAEYAFEQFSLCSNYAALDINFGGPTVSCANGDTFLFTCGECSSLLDTVYLFPYCTTSSTACTAGATVAPSVSPPPTAATTDVVATTAAAGGSSETTTAVTSTAFAAGGATGTSTAATSTTSAAFLTTTVAAAATSVSLRAAPLAAAVLLAVLAGLFL